MRAIALLGGAAPRGPPARGELAAGDEGRDGEFDAISPNENSRFTAGVWLPSCSVPIPNHKMAPNNRQAASALMAYRTAALPAFLLATSGRRKMAVKAGWSCLGFGGASSVRSTMMGRLMPGRMGRFTGAHQAIPPVGAPEERWQWKSRGTKPCSDTLASGGSELKGAGGTTKSVRSGSAPACAASAGRDGCTPGRMATLLSSMPGSLVCGCASRGSCSSGMAESGTGRHPPQAGMVSTGSAGRPSA